VEDILESGKPSLSSLSLFSPVAPLPFSSPSLLLGLVICYGDLRSCIADSMGKEALPSSALRAFDSLNSLRYFVGRLVFPSCGFSVRLLQGKSLGFGTAGEAGQAAAGVQAQHELVARALSRRAAWRRRRRRQQLALLQGYSRQGTGQAQARLSTQHRGCNRTSRAGPRQGTFEGLDEQHSSSMQQLVADQVQHAR